MPAKPLQHPPRSIAAWLLSYRGARCFTHKTYYNHIGGYSSLTKLHVSLLLVFFYKNNHYIWFAALQGYGTSTAYSGT